jgi:hypothetical protein
MSSTEARGKENNNISSLRSLLSAPCIFTRHSFPDPFCLSSLVISSQESTEDTEIVKNLSVISVASCKNPFLFRLPLGELCVFARD